MKDLVLLLFHPPPHKHCLVAPSLLLLWRGHLRLLFLANFITKFILYLFFNYFFTFPPNDSAAAAATQRSKMRIKGSTDACKKGKS